MITRHVQRGKRAREERRRSGRKAEGRGEDTATKRSWRGDAEVWQRLEFGSWGTGTLGTFRVLGRRSQAPRSISSWEVSIFPLHQGATFFLVFVSSRFFCAPWTPTNRRPEALGAARQKCGGLLVMLAGEAEEPRNGSRAVRRKPSGPTGRGQVRAVLDQPAEFPRQGLPRKV